MNRMDTGRRGDAGPDLDLRLLAQMEDERGLDSLLILLEREEVSDVSRARVLDYLDAREVERINDHVQRGVHGRSHGAMLGWLLVLCAVGGLAALML